MKLRQQKFVLEQRGSSFIVVPVAMYGAII